MNLPDAPIAQEGFFVTHFLTVADQAKSRDFYVGILGGKVIREKDPCYVKLANSWIILNSGGGPTPDKPGRAVGLAMAAYLVSVRASAAIDPGKRREVSMTPANDKGIVNVPSNHSVEQTVDRLKNILQSKGVTLFVLVDHSGEAEKVGMKMRPTKLLIFGSPKAGTPLMLAAPSIAIDLPLKILVWEDDKGKVWISYNSTEYLRKRHGFPQELLANIAVVETFAAKAAE